MVSLRKRPRQERIDRLVERQFSHIERQLRRAKGPKPWAQKKIQNLMQEIAQQEAERLQRFWVSVEDWRSLGHCGDWPTLKSRRRRRQRDNAAERRAMARYLAEQPGLVVMEPDRPASKK